jgi:hypothetical protein
MIGNTLLPQATGQILRMKAGIEEIYSNML